MLPPVVMPVRDHDRVLRLVSGGSVVIDRDQDVCLGRSAFTPAAALSTTQVTKGRLMPFLDPGA